MTKLLTAMYCTISPDFLFFLGVYFPESLVFFAVHVLPIECVVIHNS